MAVASPDRLRDDVVRLMHRGAGVRDYSLAAARILGRAIPFDGVCLLVLDPATLLPTYDVVENGLPPAATARMAEIEIRGNDVNAFNALAHSRDHTASLSEATDGELDRSRRHREVRRPNGFGDELRAALVADRSAWGGLTLLRTLDRKDFSPADTALVSSLSPHIAEGLRRAVLLSTLSVDRPADEDPAGLLLLAPDNSIAHANPAAETWLAELHDSGPDQLPPPVVIAVANRARSIADGHAAPGAIARARVRSEAGRWLRVHASTLGANTAVILEPARPQDLAPLIADAYGLTDRERALTQLVAQGLHTNAIAARLHISPWTVQDHLKSIFEKVDVSTRGELVARLFFEHYAPRLANGEPNPRILG